MHPHPVPARRPAQHRADGRGPTGAVRPLGRQLKGDGIEMVTLESTSGSAPSDFHGEELDDVISRREC